MTGTAGQKLESVPIHYHKQCGDRTGWERTRDVGSVDNADEQGCQRQDLRHVEQRSQPPPEDILPAQDSAFSQPNPSAEHLLLSLFLKPPVLYAAIQETCVACASMEPVFAQLPSCWAAQHFRFGHCLRSIPLACIR